MSTRSNVIIKVKSEDIGKTIKFNAKKLPVKLESWGDEKVRTKCKPVIIEKQYIGIYCHWDGYPSGVGKALVENFTDYDSVLNLVAGGDCSSINQDSVIHYANRDGEDWDFIKPVQSDEIKVCGGLTEYAYIFDEDGLWKIGIIKYGKDDEGKTNYDDEYIDDIVDLDEDVITNGHPSERE